jgi:biotin transport system ATP-binding protein
MPESLNSDVHMGRPIIKIENLSHRYEDGSYGLRDISLEIDEGAFVVVAGANGSGKTTLLRHLNGLLTPTAGSVEVDGQSVSSNPARARRLVGMMFQDAASQIIGDTVGEDVAFGPENLRLDREDVDRRVEQALSRVGLANFAGRRPHLLSGGEKRRLAIAAILAMQPSIVVFDEPFTSLDYPGTRQILEQMVELQQTGHTLLVTTHELEKVLAHADRLMILHDGRLVRDGVPASVLADAEAFGVRSPISRESRTGIEGLSWLN